MQRFQWLASPKNPTPIQGSYSDFMGLRDPWYLGSKSALRAPYKASEAVSFSAAPRTGSRHAPSASRPSNRDLRFPGWAAGVFDAVYGRIADSARLAAAGMSFVPHERSMRSRALPMAFWPTSSPLRVHLGSSGTGNRGRSTATRTSTILPTERRFPRPGAILGARVDLDSRDGWGIMSH